MRDARARAVFVLSAIVLAVLYGTEAGRSNWFPNPQISLAMTTVRDVSRYWENDLGLKPTRHLVPARNPGRPRGDKGFRILRPDEIEPGYVAIAGLSSDQKRSAFSVTLYDMTGRVLHVWPVNYRALDPTGPGGLNVMIHGMELFPDGSIAVVFDEGRVMARLDACGRPIWISKGAYSHSVVSDGQGHLVSWRNYKITWVDATTGRKLREMGLLKQIIPQGGGQLGIFSILSHVYSENGKVQYLVDPFHPNSVKPLVSAMAAAFPEFKVGDLLISLREPDLVAVIDPVTGHVKWWQNGPWYKQHDPEFEADGTITVYDNHPSSGVSRIVKVNPRTHGIRVLFQGSKQIPFYSWQRGKHQVLANGNILITEPEHGRVFEVDAQGRLVWEREMVWDSTQNLIVTGARHLAPDFYAHGLPACATDGK